MTRALIYLQAVGIKNGAIQRARRLRQPRYLTATLLGAAYFYFLFFRRGASPADGPGAPAGPANIGLLMGVAMAAVIMTARIVYLWIFSADRAALAFSEAEVAFLFQAPVTRRALVNYKLLKSQVRILFSAALFSLLSLRFSMFGGSVWMHAVGWWILLSVLDLHSIAASFTRERLLDVGLNPARRRALFCGGILVIGVALWWWLRRTIPAPRAADLTGPMAMLHYCEGVLATAPLSWLLTPCAWVLRPFFAQDLAGFLQSLGPALLILAAHYVWVIRSEVAFEDASVELARRQAERGEARRQGNWSGQERAAKKRRDPFILQPTGPAPYALLWRNLIAAGPWFYPRNWLLVSTGVLGAMVWLGSRPEHRMAMVFVPGVALPMGLFALVAGPMFMRRNVRLMMQRLDVVKTYPLRGWQIVLGEMLAPIALITAIEWLLLAVVAVASRTFGGELGFVARFSCIGATGIGLLVPPVVGLMIGIPFAATLYFPSWMSSLNSTGGGVAAMGQRMIFAGGYLIVLVAALAPAALVGAAPYFLVLWLSGSQAAALFAGAGAAALTLFAEFAAAVWWLGGRCERFDLSLEALPS